MGVNRTERVELVNMCMIYDRATKQVLVEDKTDVDWKFGHTFPGGHVEPGEPVADAMIREVFEETGLHITQLEACGCVEWFDQQAGYRKIGFLYRTSHFSGQLKQSSEGRIFWLPLADLSEKNTAESFMEMLAIFTEPTTVSAVSSVMNGQLHLTANQKHDQ
ncbi:8-oxo-dGTP diphosphatase [Lactobacillus sp. LC28-10]|uniref:8-oxo-dGTP diphosphatase n=1 Tax=Secundilactobacillus angelensis TaxID=2722706 RepID=A0ABX1KY46_9LACO|nr:8-oxo-dGTP diphosphatase [Secundilactobacillus angelensis]MCH5461434.1 8-oxo-dGTP diphosphatase [Secundilactobacillus angelensis]NLR17753.1 8-oxo-dGTP diphosphatase [Secundilactobacillus angelensis]